MKDMQYLQVICTVSSIFSHSTLSLPFPLIYMFSLKISGFGYELHEHSII